MTAIDRRTDTLPGGRETAPLLQNERVRTIPSVSEVIRFHTKSNYLRLEAIIQSDVPSCRFAWKCIIPLTM
jgi:hypothetical protein